MCMKSSEMTPCSLQYSAFRLRSASKQHKFRVHRLTNRKRTTAKEAKGTEMEIKNLKLYMENQSIIEENNKLRKKALLLVQENQALSSQLQHKQKHLSQQNNSNFHALLPSN